MTEQTYEASVPISRELAEYMAANPGVVEAFIERRINEQFIKQVKDMTDGWLLGEEK